MCWSIYDNLAHCVFLTRYTCNANTKDINNVDNQKEEKKVIR